MEEIKKKWVLKTNTTWVGTEQTHEIDGEYETWQEALAAFGGESEAQMQAEEDHELQWYVVEDDEDE